MRETRIRFQQHLVFFIQDDLAALEVLTETIIVESLGRRYLHDKIYTYIGDILVAINPYKELPIYSARYSFDGLKALALFTISS